MSKRTQTIVEKGDVRIVLSASDPEASDYSGTHRDFLKDTRLERVVHDEGNTFLRVANAYSSRVIFSNGVEVVNDMWRGFGIRLVDGVSCMLDDGDGNHQVSISRVSLDD